MSVKQYPPLAQKLFLITTMVIVVLYGVIVLYVYTNAHTDTKQKADAIVVLGAKPERNPCLVARVEHGITLFNKGYAKKIVFAGGYSEQDNAIEADSMKRIAHERGINDSQMLLEKESTSTFENLRNTKALLEKNDLHSIIIVTESYHSPRALLVAKKLAIPATVSPAINSTCVHIGKYILREPVSLLWYSINGRI